MDGMMLCTRMCCCRLVREALRGGSTIKRACARYQMSLQQLGC